jgi:hypothetical protein
LTAFAAGCGEAPQATVEAAPSPMLQHVSFTAVADPAAGKFQIVNGPQALFAPVTQDHDGNANTVASGSAQIYSPQVAFVTGSAIPSGCNTGSAQVMTADVEVFSGFTEQLRNVYVRIISRSGGQTFCGASAAAGSFASSLNPNLFLYLYAPLNAGTFAGPPATAIRRSLKWGINLPDNGPFWFDGELWAEVIPQPPSINKPADGAIFNTGDPTAEVVFLWTSDPSANGSAPNGAVPYPSSTGSVQLTILRCNANSTGAYNPAACTTTFQAPTIMTKAENKILVPTGYWYQWSVRSVFRLPGNATDSIGTLVTTRSFRAGN